MGLSFAEASLLHWEHYKHSVSVTTRDTLKCIILISELYEGSTCWLFFSYSLVRSTECLALHWHTQQGAGCKRVTGFTVNFQVVEGWRRKAVETFASWSVFSRDIYTTFLQKACWQINMSFIIIDGLTFFASSEMQTWLAEKRKVQWDVILCVISTNFLQFSMCLRQVLAV
jgi:hypothetical protein